MSSVVSVRVREDIKRILEKGCIVLYKTKEFRKVFMFYREPPWQRS